MNEKELVSIAGNFGSRSSEKNKFWLQHERYAGYLADIFGAVGRSTEDVAMVLCRPEHSEPWCKPQNLGKKGPFW